MLLRNIQYMNRGRFENHVCYFVPRREIEPQYRAAGFEPIYPDHRSRSHGPRTFSRLVRLIGNQKIDLVHTNLTLDRVYAGIAAGACRIPMVMTLHTAHVPRPTGSGLSFYKMKGKPRSICCSARYRGPHRHSSHIEGAERGLKGMPGLHTLGNWHPTVSPVGCLLSSVVRLTLLYIFRSP